MLFSSVLGTFGGASKLVHSLSNGTKLTFSLTKGTGTLLQDDAGGLAVSTTGTTIASTMSVAVAGKTKTATLSSITTDAALGTLNFSKVNLVGGSLTFAGDAKTVSLSSVSNGALTFHGSAPLSLSLGNAADCTIQSTQPFTSLSSNTFFSSAPRVSAITAPWIGTLYCKNEFLPDLTLTGAGAPKGVTLKTANVIGDVFRSHWSITGNVDSLLMGTGFDAFFNGNITGKVKTLQVRNSIDGSNLAAASFGTISIHNGLSLSHVLAGANFGPDGVLGGGDDTFGVGSIGSLSINNSVQNHTVIAAGLVVADGVFPLTGNDSLLPGSSIGTISVHNTLSTNSRILAAKLPATAKIHISKVKTSDPRFKLP